MAQYEIKFKIWGEYPNSYDGVCQVELSDDEVQQLIALMQEYGTSDVEELELEDNLPTVYDKISDACDEVAIDILEKDWLDSAIYYISDCDYDEHKLISHCQWEYGCPSFDEEDDDDEEGYDEEDNESEGEDNTSEERQYEGFYDWLHAFWKTATRDEQEDLLFNYMGVDEFMLCEARSYFCDKYYIAIPQAIIEMAGVEE